MLEYLDRLFKIIGVVTGFGHRDSQAFTCRGTKYGCAALACRVHLEGWGTQ